jgi:hypothetical protein
VKEVIKANMYKTTINGCSIFGNLSRGGGKRDGWN